MDYAIAMTTRGLATPVAIDLIILGLGIYFWWRNLRTGLVVAINLLLLFLWFTIAGYKANVELNANTLQVAIPVWGHAVPLKSLDVQDARRVDLSRRTDLRPVKESAGFGVQGFRLGWFYLANHEKALLALGDESKAVYIPTTEGFSILVSPEHPQAFLQALKHSAD